MVSGRPLLKPDLTADSDTPSAAAAARADAYTTPRMRTRIGSAGPSPTLSSVPLRRAAAIAGCVTPCAAAAALSLMYATPRIVTGFPPAFT